MAVIIAKQKDIDAYFEDDFSINQSSIKPLQEGLDKLLADALDYFWVARSVHETKKTSNCL